MTHKELIEWGVFDQIRAADAEHKRLVARASKH